MLAENLTFLATFISTSGLAAIGILAAQQLLQTHKTNEFQTLLFQQIFLFSFFIYSIWGNLMLRQVITEINLTREMNDRLAFFIPLPGLPFLVVSWYMLLKFSFNVNGRQVTKKWIYGYFAGSVLMIFLILYLFHAGYISTPDNPDIFLIRTFILANLFIHGLFFLPFLKSKTAPAALQIKNSLFRCIAFSLGGIFIGTSAAAFVSTAGFAGLAISFLLIFASGAFLPVCFRYSFPTVKQEPEKTTGNFKSFCLKYNISKREAEIVQQICAGNTNRAIAENLFITIQTVKDHTHRIYTKTQVKNRIQLANLVREKAGKAK